MYYPFKFILFLLRRKRIFTRWESAFKNLIHGKVVVKESSFYQEREFPRLYRLPTLAIKMMIYNAKKKDFKIHFKGFTMPTPPTLGEVLLGEDNKAVLVKPSDKITVYDDNVFFRK